MLLIEIRVFYGWFLKMKPITDWCKHKALIFDAQGHFIGIKNIDYKEESFVFKNRIFNFLPGEASFFKLRYWFSTTKYYFYNFDNPMPICLDGENKSVINPIAYKRILETDLIKKLNDLARNNFLSWLLQPKVLIILVIIIGAVWFFASGNTPQDLVGYASGNG